MNYNHRSSQGLTLPFALILTFIFSALVGVSYLFVSVNLHQMQSSLQGLQAESVAEGFNEKIKARLNTKSKIQLSPQQEEKLKSSTEGEEDAAGDDDEDLAGEEEFDENAEDFDEYYADEVLKISRYITFKEPKQEESQDTQTQSSSGSNENTAPPPNPLENVEMIGSIDIPTGTVLAKGVMIVVYKEESVSFMLKEIVEDGSQIKPKLPIPIIRSLTPNYAESNSRTGIVLSGDNLGYDQKARFSNKEITIEDIKAGPTVQALIGEGVMSGITYLYWNNVRTEFYITPIYDGSPRPEISDIKTSDGDQLISVNAGQKHLSITISGTNLSSKKDLPVVIPDVVGIIPKLQNNLAGMKEISITLDISAKVEPGVHSLAVATGGGLSNSWIFSVLPSEKQEDLSGNIARISSSLTLLDVKVLENLLPVIGEEDNNNVNNQGNNSSKQNKKSQGNPQDDTNNDEEISEAAKLTPFANVDLETVWLLETTAKIGKTVKTVSEVVNRQLPNIHAGLITNGSVKLEGGGYQIVGNTNSMTILTEPTYISNTVLMVEGPPEETEESIQTQPQEPVQKSPAELGFTPGSLITVYMDSDRISELDYAVISKIGRDTIELISPGLKDFHYEMDQVYQFTPPVITGEKIDEQEAEKHIVPKEFAISIPNYANPQTIFRSDIEQFAELADLYTNDSNVPKDEYDIPLGYMGLSYIDGTPVYDKSNPLIGKGVLIIDTRSDNQGRPTGQVEFSGDSKGQSTFSGVVYIKGNLRIDGNVTINGALVVDNDQRGGSVEIADNALGKIIYDERAIKQSILSTPFTTRAGSIIISNKPINLQGYVQSGSTPQQVSTSSGALPGEVPQPPQPETPQASTKQPEEALVEEEKVPGVQTIQIQPHGGKSAEEELIDLF